MRLQTDRIDLYLLHWRGNVALAETLAALMALRKAGKIRHYGVSNLDLVPTPAQLAELDTLFAPPSGPRPLEML